MHPEAAPTVFHYPRVGTPNAAVELVIVARGGGRSRPVEWDRARFPYLAAVTWPERGPLTYRPETYEADWCGEWAERDDTWQEDGE